MKLRIALLVAVLCSACAPTRYYYNFDYLKHGSKKPIQQENISVLQVDPEYLTASSDSAVVVVAPILPSIVAEQKSVASKAPSVSERRQAKVRKLVAKLPLKYLRPDRPTPLNPDGDAKKNGWAIAGFVLSLVGWVVLWPLLILGVIFSAMGLKSQKRGMAIAGLVIALAGLIVVLIAANQGKI